MRELIPVYSALLAAGPLVIAFVYKQLTELKIEQTNPSPGRNALLICLGTAFAFTVGVLGLLVNAVTPNPMSTNAIHLLITLFSALGFFFAFFCSAVDRTKPKPE